jgi:GT2 family glycosyltransferase
MYEPSVAIIILNWNGFRDTLELISSLKNICYKNFSIIIIDNGSDEARFNDFKQQLSSEIKIIRNNLNLGFTGGNNVGIRYALKHNFEYVLLLNNDTIVDQDFLSELITKAQKEEGDIVGPVTYNYNDKNTVQSAGGHINLYTGKVVHFKKPAETINFISGTCMLMKCSTIKTHQLLFDDKFFAYWEESDLCFRSIEKRCKISIAEKSKIYHKTSQTSRYLSSFYVYQMLKNQLFFMRKHCRIYQLPTYLLFYFLRNVLGYVFLSFPKNLINIKIIPKAIINGLIS